MARCIALTLAVLVVAPAGAQAAGFGATEPLTDRRAPAVQPASYVSASAVRSPANAVRIYRSYTNGTPLKYVDVPVSRVVRQISVSQNPATDGLVTWTEDGSSQSVTRAVFWPANADQPDPAHDLLNGTTSGGAIYAVLDPGRSATVLWQQDAGGYQVTTSDAGAANPWSSPTAFPYGDGIGASLPDGRALFAERQRVDVAGDPPAYLRLLVATRAAGLPFTSPAVVAGSAPPGGRSLSEPPKAGISPGGRAMVAYALQPNHPLSGTPPCQTGDGQVGIALGAIAAQGTASFTTKVVSASDADALQPRTPVAGTDDRIAAAWEELTGPCNTANRPERHAAAYAAPGQDTQTTGTVPAVFGSLWWQADGQLYLTSTPPGGAAMGTPYDTGVPVQTISDGAPSTGGGTGSPGGTGTGDPSSSTGSGSGTGGASTGTTPPVAGKPPATSGTAPASVKTIRTQFHTSQDGTVRQVTTVPGTGVLQTELFVRRTGLVSAAASPTVSIGRFRKSVKKAGSVTLTLKLKGRALKALRKRHKLAVSVHTTFRPTAGGSAIRRTSAVTFKRRH